MHVLRPGVRVMFLILAVFGLIGGVVLETLGIVAGDAGQLERILGIACFAMAAAGFVGIWADDGARDPHRVRLSITFGDVVSAIAIAPIAMVCLGVFLLTLIPALYLMLPFLIKWAHDPDEPGKLAPLSRRMLTAPAPAYA